MKFPSPVLRYYPSICLEKLENARKIFIQNTRPFPRTENRPHTSHVPGLLIPQLQQNLNIWREFIIICSYINMRIHLNPVTLKFET